MRNVLKSLRAVAFWAIGLGPLAAYVAFVLLLGSAPGCVRVPSPRNPEVSVSPERAIAEAEQLASEHEREKRAASTRFRLSVKRLEAETGVTLAELTAAHDEAVEKADAEAAAIRQATATAIKEAEERAAAWTQGLGAVAGIAQSSGIPGVATIGGLLAGGIGIFSAFGSRRKATSEAEQRKAVEDAASRVIDSIDILKRLDPAVAKAFKDNHRDLIEWQGAAGMQLVNRIQHS